jgi:hypothetical protein
MESPKPSSNAPAGFSKSPTKTALKKADSPCQAPGTVLSPDKFDILCGRGLDYYGKFKGYIFSSSTYAPSDALDRKPR